MTAQLMSRERLEEIVSDQMINQGSEFAMLARMALAAMDSEPQTDDVLSNLLWYSQEATCHSDPNYYCEFQRLATPGLIAGIIRELQERRKADSEPVAYISKADFDAGYPHILARRDFNKACTMPVYAAPQPAPVVPDESYQKLSELYHAQEKRLFKIAKRIKGPTFDKYSHSPSQAIDVLEAVIFGEDDACRAAMLAATPQPPGSEPATLPGKWIPVSEQMPESKPGSYEYLVFETLNNRVNHDYWNAPDKGDDAFTPFWNYYGGHVTHWMPLPAAPQEEKP